MKKTQRKRLTKLYNDPQTFCAFLIVIWRKLNAMNKCISSTTRCLRIRSSGSSEWVILEAAEKRRVNLAVVETLVNVLEKEINKPVDEETLEAEKKAQKNSAQGVDEVNLLDERFRSNERKRQAARASQTTGS